MIDGQVSIFSEVLQLNSGSAIGGRLNASRTELDHGNSPSWPASASRSDAVLGAASAGRGEIQFETNGRLRRPVLALRRPGITGGHPARHTTVLNWRLNFHRALPYIEVANFHGDREGNGCRRIL
ncbi:hypothetical protein [Bradyrhizobium sp. UFLA01-814]|uniref:hypothetical protein n=1 Tax=Bradyrhizobium sp. UFLA01-814 TaxID=3023480 RepID=UPI00398BA946